MWDFVVILLILLVYIFILHLRWKKRFNSYLKKMKEEEAQIIHLEKMASLGILSAGVAHEINNPLTFLITNLNILLSYMDQEGRISEDKMKEVRPIVEECLEGTNRIKRVIGDLLSFSRRSKGKKALTDINRLLDATIKILWNEIKYKVDIIKDYRASTRIWVDPNQISQVFLNIIINGAYAIKDRGTIYISTHEDGENIFTRISDTGCGIPQKELSKIFEPFYTTRGGTGLGLSVSNTIVKSHGGEIKIESEVGRGTSFTIILPKKAKD
jgi:signal transduction histidine kinase